MAHVAETVGVNSIAASTSSLGRKVKRTPATQRYLTMTPEQLREAGKRFERYSVGGKT